ncbi:unnamed protein product [Amoebophrya sp. A25]|nr:unnamed protein product [Amoebophrya sp. A25]|eukprot:GSA25T00021803001.1
MGSGGEQHSAAEKSTSDGGSLPLHHDLSSHLDLSDATAEMIEKRIFPPLNQVAVGSSAAPQPAAGQHEAVVEYEVPFNPEDALDPALIAGLEYLQDRNLDEIQQSRQGDVEAQASKISRQDVMDFMHLLRPTRFKNFEHEMSNFTWLL